MSKAPIIVWIRRDLRVSDNPALFNASKQECPVIPVFIWSPDEEGDWPNGSASNWWLHHSLISLQRAFNKYDANLILREGNSVEQLTQIAKATGASAVYWNTRYEPAGAEVDKNVADHLKTVGLEVRTFASHLLHQPDVVKTGSGKPYQVFTPFWKNLQRHLEVAAPFPAPATLLSTNKTTGLQSISVDELALLPAINWDADFYEAWKPGEQAAQQRLEVFVDEILPGYPTSRDIPSLDGTSRMSPHLHFGEISPRQIWHVVSKQITHPGLAEAAECYLRELAWREFSYHLTHHFPQTALQNLRPAFDEFEWHNNNEWLRRWQEGTTGYPIVDAGMRQLWTTGWMHNRVRMIVASFLTKHLLIAWQEGAKWFWDTLVDANLANNTMGWQWSAGSGADAQPYFRIFNPMTQSERFDPKGLYIKKWVPELQNLPTKYLHTPWLLPQPLQQSLGFTPGRTYPLPIVDHKEARKKALDTYQKIR